MATPSSGVTVDEELGTKSGGAAQHWEGADRTTNEEDGDDRGIVLAAIQTGARTDLKLAKDGRTVLHPQPSDDPNDPLNWSWKKKHAILTVIVFGSFSCDFSAGTQSTVVQQGIDWNMSPNAVNKANNLNILMIGIGGLIWVPVCRFIGRGPVMFWTTIFGFAFILGGTVVQNFESYYAMRGLQTAFLSSYLTIGLIVITDVFYFHEHARKIGIWIASVLIAPNLAPVFANLILYYLNEWRPVWYMVLPVVAITLILVPVLADETYYDRTISLERQPARGSRISRLTGAWQIRNHTYFPSVWSSTLHLLKHMARPLVIACFFYYLLAYMWFIGTAIAGPILLQTPREAGGYGFNSKVVALISIAPLVGVGVGELFGHFFNDWVADRYIRRHNGTFVPEARLITNYLVTLIMVPGLVLLGQVLEKHLHWIGIVFGWGMYTAGACALSVALFAYMADSYPLATGEVSAILNLSRCAGGFSVGYFELEWGLKSGYDVSFGIQAAIVASSIFMLISFKFFGHRLRVWGGSPILHTKLQSQ
ncbi:MFS general substrate transporter [Cadophora sp. DSE1049]|nr:MFS general substrate transporter [Cadophora sp. DSE1049]